MARVNYRKCDICGCELHERHYSLILISLINRIDICSYCLNKLKQIELDSKSESLMIQGAFNRMPDEYRRKENQKLQAAYAEGVEATIKQIYLNRVRN